LAKYSTLLNEDIKKSNDWKARMLKAGLSNYGLDDDEMPEEWSGLDEATKKERLDAAISQLINNPRA
jgi:hypothetical protein